jgi:hypothetical protein
MSLELWKQHGWLREYKTSLEEVASILALVDRDLTDATRAEVSTDWRFNSDCQFADPKFREA